ncbi:hypothetical protein GN956_G17357 [Arapaima gigas]
MTHGGHVRTAAGPVTPVDSVIQCWGWSGVVLVELRSVSCLNALRLQRPDFSRLPSCRSETPFPRLLFPRGT